MTNPFNFRFVLTASQILELAYDLLKQTIEFADSLSRVQTFDVNREIHSNTIKFWHLDKEYTLTVYSAKAICLSYYCPTNDYAGSQTFNSIEKCFEALNKIATLEVQISEHQYTQPSRVVTVQNKRWETPTVTSPEIKTGKEKMAEYNNTYDVEDHLGSGLPGLKVVGKIDLSNYGA